MSAACRPGCGACCIAPSISAPLPGYPAGKLAGVHCPHLTEDLRCALFGRPERPAVCRDLQPAPDMCGASAAEALATLSRWERLTRPEDPEDSEGPEGPEGPEDPCVRRLDRAGRTSAGPDKPGKRSP